METESLGRSDGRTDGWTDLQDIILIPIPLFFLYMATAILSKEVFLTPSFIPTCRSAWIIVQATREMSAHNHSFVMIKIY